MVIDPNYLLVWQSVKAIWRQIEQVNLSFHWITNFWLSKIPADKLSIRQEFARNLTTEDSIVVSAVMYNCCVHKTDHRSLFTDHPFLPSLTAGSLSTIVSSKATFPALFASR